MVLQHRHSCPTEMCTFGDKHCEAKTLVGSYMYFLGAKHLSRHFLEPSVLIFLAAWDAELNRGFSIGLHV